MERPSAIAVKPAENYTIIVDFDNGERRIFDVKPYINGKWYGELKDLAIFQSVHIAGLSVEWKNGQDICPDELYYNSKPIE